MLSDLASPAVETAHDPHAGSMTRDIVDASLASSDRRRWFLDSLLLVCLLLMVIIKCNIPASGMDEDVWWHISTGDWILKHHAFPTQDIFANYTMGSPWIAYTWLFDVATSKIHSAWGLHGILTLTMLL